MKLPYRIALVLGIILLLMQLYPVNRSASAIEPNNDFFSLVDAPQEIVSRIHTSCYDCHSNQTTYPWYAFVAPFSWIVQDHINEGREHLNFSEWGNYDPKEKVHKLEECAEEVQKGKMPFKGYLTYHKEARFSLEEKEKLVSFFNSLRN